MNCRLIAALFCVLFLSGCVATTGGGGLKLSFLMTDTEKVIEKQKIKIENGTTGYWESYLELQNYILSDKKAEQEKIIIFIDSIEGFRENALSEINKKIGWIKTTREITTIKNNVEDARSIKVFSSVDLSNLIEHLNTIIEKKNRSGEIPFVLTDGYSKWSPLVTPEHQRIIFYRSISQLAEKTQICNHNTIEQINAIIEYLESEYCSDSDKLFFKNKVKEFDLEPRVIIKTLYGIMPGYVDEVKERIGISVQIETKPIDRLLEIDMLSALEKESDFIFSKKTPGIRNVRIMFDKLSYKEKEIPESRVTRTIPQHEVNPLQAVLLMPRNSSYMYEVVSGGSEISYAYEITAFNGNGEIIYNKLLRDNIRKTYNNCINRRIQNVFGGIQNASFIANSQMENECGGNNNKVSLRDLQQMVFALLLDEIKMIESIKIAIEAGAP